MESIILMDSHNNSESEKDLDSVSFSESIFSTSPSEKLWSQKIHDHLAWRVHKYVYETERHCLVENTVHESALLYVHCLPRRLEPRRVNALEFAWGMQRGTLNLNTRLNVFCLSPNFKEFWETFKWFLLPENYIIRRFHDAAMNDQDFPDIGEGPYNYRFVAHPDLKAIAIHRQIVFPDNGNEDLKPEHFMFCSYPFENISSLPCHLHPKFIICHIGWMAARTDATFLSEYVDAHPGLLELIIMILRICNKWTRPLDKTNPKHLSFLKNKIDSDDIISETYTRTGNDRIKPHISQKHPKKHRNDGKRKRIGSAALVPKKKLQILEEQLIPDYALEKKLEDILFRASNVLDSKHAQIDTPHNNSGNMIETKTGVDIEMADT